MSSVFNASSLVVVINSQTGVINVIIFPSSAFRQEPTVINPKLNSYNMALISYFKVFLVYFTLSLTILSLVSGDTGTINTNSGGSSSSGSSYGTKSYKMASRRNSNNSTSSNKKVVSSSRAMKSPSDIDTYDGALDPFASSSVDKTGLMDSSSSGWDHDTHNHNTHSNHHNHKSSLASSKSSSHQSLPQLPTRYSSYPSKSYGSGSSSSGGGSGASATSNEALYASYPYATYANYHYNPLLESYYERDRAARELAAVSRYPVSLPGAHATMAAAASSLFNSIAPHPIDVDDALALASHSHGWGWSSKEHNTYDHVNHYESKVNTNAIGLLGLLGLLNLLSTILLLFTTTTTPAAGGRRKRSADIGIGMETQEDKTRRILVEALPFLTPVAHARDGQIPLDCTLQGVCLTNRLLVKEYGVNGRPAGRRVTSAISALLEEIGHEETAVLKKRIENAGTEGRNQEDCHKKYPVCKALEVKGGPSALHFVIGMNDVPKLLEKVRNVPYSSALASLI